MPPITPRALAPTTVLKHLVSKQKRRLIVDGFDLDLTYVTEQALRVLHLRAPVHNGRLTAPPLTR